jgi:hypothetical protein
MKMMHLPSRLRHIIDITDAAIGAVRAGHDATLAVIIQRAVPRCTTAVQNPSTTASSSADRFQFRVDFSEGGSYALKAACGRGFTAVVARLLGMLEPVTEPTESKFSVERPVRTPIARAIPVRPGDRANAALIEASRGGHLLIVEMLLALDPRRHGVDPAAQSCAALLAAAAGGHDAVVAALLADTRTVFAPDLAARILHAAAACPGPGGSRTVTLLAADPRMGSAGVRLGTVERAAQAGLAETVVALMNAGGFNADENAGRPLLLAVAECRSPAVARIIAALVDTGRADVNARGTGDALTTAVSKRNLVAVRALIKHGADPSLAQFAALRAACEELTKGARRHIMEAVVDALGGIDAIPASIITADRVIASGLDIYGQITERVARSVRMVGDEQARPGGGFIHLNV